MQTIGISAGNIEYTLEEAVVDIDVLIQMLEQSKEEGATHVVGFSDNYRGAQYVRLGTKADFLDSDD